MTPQPSPQAGAAVKAADRAHVFHSWSAQELIDPLAVAGAEGSYFWDYEGKRYLDFSSGLVYTNIGYQHPKVVAAIQEQAARMTTFAPAFAVEARSEAARLIAERTPGDLDKIFFTNGGADAVEHALRMARLHTGRPKVLSAYRSYHGGTQQAVATSPATRAAGPPTAVHAGLRRGAPVAGSTTTPCTSCAAHYLLQLSGLAGHARSTGLGGDYEQLLEMFESDRAAVPPGLALRPRRAPTSRSTSRTRSPATRSWRAAARLGSAHALLRELEAVAPALGIDPANPPAAPARPTAGGAGGARAVRQPFAGRQLAGLTRRHPEPGPGVDDRLQLTGPGDRPRRSSAFMIGETSTSAFSSVKNGSPVGGSSELSCMSKTISAVRRPPRGPK
ncbi:Acetylornithine/succinyldiaminopimelate aminotransferase [Streptomyces tendae]